MAKFYAAMIALFCLFAVSLARSSVENDESTTAISLPISESRPVLREAASAETESKSPVEASIPLTKVTFRPINRRFHVGPKDPCRHHFRFYPKLRRNEIPYGNDMILSSGENSDFENAALRGEGLPNRGRWVRLHHHHHHKDGDSDSDSDSDSDDEEHDRIKKAVFKRYDYDRFDREKKLKMLKKMRKHFRLQNEEEKKSGFMRRVRKFFDHYF